MSKHSEEVKKRVEHEMWETRKIGTAVPSQAYKDGWDRIFGDKNKEDDK